MVNILIFKELLHKKMLKQVKVYLYNFKSGLNTVFNFSNPIMNFNKSKSINFFDFLMTSGEKQNLKMMPCKNTGEYWPKMFVSVSGFWLLKVLGESSVKKEKFVMKIYFQIMLNEVLESCEKEYLLM